MRKADFALVGWARRAGSLLKRAVVVRIQPAPGGGLDTAMTTKRTAHLPDLAATAILLPNVIPEWSKRVELGGMRTVRRGANAQR